jgi:peptidoglycan/xylan/chitin deacetylase (PgdA/CDA1 family)
MLRVVRPLAVALRGKGPTALSKRIWTIGKRCGLTVAQMARSLEQLSQVLQRFDCQATLPIPAVVLVRNSEVIQECQAQGMEIAVHGYSHVDYSQLAPEEQLLHLRRACEIFDSVGITASGFRAPYLRHGPDLWSSLEAAGFSYGSSQPILWDVLDTESLTPSAYAAYQRAIAFYAPWRASERLSLPWLYDRVVEIPVSLPDDEILIDRLGGESGDLIEKGWLGILSRTYQQGELFTVQLHPERTALCVEGLSSVLAEARTLAPAVWITRLDEVAAWWRARAAATVDVEEAEDGFLRLSVTGPPGTTLLMRNVEIVGPAEPWADGCLQVASATCVVRAPCQPFVGVSPACPSAMISFLRQQGYIVQVSDRSQLYSIYLDRTEFAPQDERPLLAQIEENSEPLVRLNRWPNGARSALCVTGDIDALTIWDYGLRLLERNSVEPEIALTCP